MDLLNVLYKVYFTLPRFEILGKPGKAINRILNFTLKRVLDLLVPPYYNRTIDKRPWGLNMDKREEKFIVSLTSFPARINSVWITIETLMRQTFKPDMIILWLAESQFPDRILPDSISRLESKGLTVRFCEDLRSHKKYYYSLINYPNTNVITFDDDLYFDRHAVENLVELHRRFPGSVATNRAHKITFSGTMVNPYRKWKHNVTDTNPSHLLVATGGAGTLYPKNSMPEETFDKELFMRICFSADDIWLKVMELKNKTKVVTNRRYNKSYVAVRSTQNGKLATGNVMDGGNDVQLVNTLNHFNIQLAINMD